MAAEQRLRHGVCLCAFGLCVIDAGGGLGWLGACLARSIRASSCRCLLRIAHAAVHDGTGQHDTRPATSSLAAWHATPCHFCSGTSLGERWRISSSACRPLPTHTSQQVRRSPRARACPHSGGSQHPPPTRLRARTRPRSRPAISEWRIAAPDGNVTRDAPRALVRSAHVFVSVCTCVHV
jgi:hypothetical protein